MIAPPEFHQLFAPALIVTERQSTSMFGKSRVIAAVTAARSTWPRREASSPPPLNTESHSSPATSSSSTHGSLLATFSPQMLMNFRYRRYGWPSSLNMPCTTP